MRLLAWLVLLFATGCAAASDRPVFYVYTYDSFASEWGPGTVIEPLFEAECACDLRFVAAGDGAAVLARLMLEGEHGRADLVLGLDTSLLPEARTSGLFTPHGITLPALNLPVAFADTVFVPFDWGQFAFVYDQTKGAAPPASLEDLRHLPPETRLVIEDPRTSTPGLGLLLWVKAVYGDRAADFWRDVKPNILTVTAGWSEAYGLFLGGEADLVLSYSTSPAYHRIAEGDDSKAAAVFTEGQYLQIELAAIPARSAQPNLARQFLGFMLGESFQAAIPVTNWMFPARMPAGGLPEGFPDAGQAGKGILLPEADLAMVKDAALAEWLEVMAQ